MADSGSFGGAEIFPSVGEARAEFSAAQHLLSAARLAFDEATCPEVAAFRASLIAEYAQQVAVAAETLARVASLAARPKT